MDKLNFTFNEQGWGNGCEMINPGNRSKLASGKNTIYYQFCQETDADRGVLRANFDGEG
jgi:hypothetical protein